MTARGTLRRLDVQGHFLAWRSDALALSALISLAVLIKWKWFFGDVCWANYQDNTNLFLPVFSAISARLASGDIPICLPGILGGLRLDTCPHFHIFYPFYFLYLNVFPSPLQCAILVHRIILFHYLLLAANTYALGRILNFRPPSAVVAALTFASSVAVQSEMSWVTILSATTWLPLVLGGLQLILVGKPRIGICLLTASAILLVLAQPGQQVIIASVSCALLLLGHLIMSRNSLGDVRKTIFSILLALLCISIAVGPYLWNLSQFHSNAIRWLGANFGHVVGAEKIPAAALAEHGLSFHDAINVLYLSRPHTVIGHIFLGPTIAVLLVVGLLAACTPKNRWFLPWGLLSFFFAAFSFSWVAQHITYYLPLFNKIREATYFGIPATLFGILCGIFGLEALFSPGSVLARRQWLLLPISLLLFASIVLSAIADRQSGQHIVYPIVLCARLIICIILLILTYYSALGRESRVRQILLSAAVLLGALPPIVNEPALIKDNDARSKELVDIDSALNHFAASHREIAFSRIDMPWGGAIDWNMQGLYFHLNSFQGYWQPQDFTQFSRLYWIRGRSWAARLAGLGYRVVPIESAKIAGWKTLETVGTWSLQKDDKAKPRIYVESRIAGTYEGDDDYFQKVEASAGKIAGLWVSKLADESLTHLLGGASRRNVANTTISVERSSDEVVQLIVDSDQPVAVILDEYRELGWRVKVNGVAERTFNANLTQAGVLVGEGQSNIIFYMNTTSRCLLQLWPLISSLAFAIGFTWYLTATHHIQSVRR